MANDMSIAQNLEVAFTEIDEGTGNGHYDASDAYMAMTETVREMSVSTRTPALSKVGVYFFQDGSCLYFNLGEKEFYSLC